MEWKGKINYCSITEIEVPKISTENNNLASCFYRVSHVLLFMIE